MASFISIFFVFLGLVALAAVIAAMVFIYIKIMPTKYDGKFANSKFQKLHDFFHFKKLYIESVLRFFFVLATVSCIVGGAYIIVTSIFSFLFTIQYFNILGLLLGILVGVLTMVLGTVITRLLYEGTMMFIILVKNVMEINKKTKDQNQQ